MPQQKATSFADDLAQVRTGGFSSDLDAVRKTPTDEKPKIPMFVMMNGQPVDLNTVPKPIKVLFAIGATAGGAMATGGASLLAQAGAQGLIGAGLGALDSERPEDIAGNAMAGGALGAASGAIGGAVGKMAGNVARNAKPAMKVVNGQLVKTAEAPAARIIGRAIPFGTRVGQLGGLLGGSEAGVNSAILGAANTAKTVAPAVPTINDLLIRLLTPRRQQ